MTRAVLQRFHITGQLVAQTPICVAGLGNVSAADITLAINGRGRFYIPGTSLAGPMRTWFRAVFGEVLTDSLWGCIPPRGSTQKGHASLVLVEDAVVQEEAWPEIRDGVGIDRHTGAAAEKFKFDRQILPKGARFDFAMSIEQPHPDALPDGIGNADIKAAIAGMAQLLAALQRGRLRMGGGKTRGLGRLKLDGLCIEQHALSTRAGVLALLEGETKAHKESEALSVLDPAWERHRRELPHLTIRIGWRAEGPVMVKSGDEGLSVDMLPLMSRGADGKLVQVLTGAGLKGVLRSMSERICATLWPEEQSPSPAAPDDFLTQLDRYPLVQLLYGARKRTADDANCAQLGLGALFVDDCYADRPGTAPERWQAVLSAGRGDQKSKGAFAPVVEALEGAGLAQKMRPTAHVAIDRWTGGAANGALYSVLQPLGTQWSPIELTLDLNRLLATDPADQTPQQSRALAALALLVLTLRELAGNRIPLGFAGNRGMGSITVEEIAFEVAGERPEELACLDDLDGFQLTPQDFSIFDQLRPLQPLEDAWQNWQKLHDSGAAA